MLLSLSRLLSAILLVLFLFHVYTFHKEPKHSIRSKLQPAQDVSLNSPYAYVFYAASDEYACSALVNIERLKSDFHTPHDIYMLITNAISEEILLQIAYYNVTVINYVPPTLAGGSIQYYENCLLKLIAFKLHYFVPLSKVPPVRILVLDADQLILKSLDHVFNLPVVDLAAPRAYWLSKEIVSSAFLLITLSDRLWNRVDEALGGLRSGAYDMDIVNDLFGDTVMILPGHYVTINSHWEDNNIPSWFRGDTSLGSTDIYTNKDLQKWTADAQPRNGVYHDLILTYQEASVLHFTAFGKPWGHSMETIRQRRPAAHPVFLHQFKMWKTIAEKVCPIDLGPIHV